MTYESWTETQLRNDVAKLEDERQRLCLELVSAYQQSADNWKRAEMYRRRAFAMRKLAGVLRHELREFAKDYCDDMSDAIALIGCSRCD